MNVLAFVKKELYNFADLFYPRICLACGRSLLKEEEILCSYCDLQLPKTEFHLWKNNPVFRLFDGRVKIESAAVRYFFKKGGNVQNLLHNFKYRGYKDIGVKIGEDYGRELMLSPLFKETDYIIPVPLHYKKERMRGFNQSERFAFGLGLSMKAKSEVGNLVRIVHSSSQTKKSRWERWKNVNAVFELKNPERLKDKHILLVDDVITTGSTLEACINVIGQVENVKISVAAIASPTGV